MAERIKISDCAALYLVYGDLGRVKEDFYVCNGKLLFGRLAFGDVLKCVSLELRRQDQLISEYATVVCSQAIFGGAKAGGEGPVLSELTPTDGIELDQLLVKMPFPSDRRVDRVALILDKGAANITGGGEA